MGKKNFCGCYRCDPNLGRRLRVRENEKFERKMVAEEIDPPEETVYDSWFDWDAHYDL